MEDTPYWSTHQLSLGGVLVGYTSSVIAPLIGDGEVFIREIKNTRNFLTHYDKKQERKAVHGTELVELTRVLSFLIRACLLRELGLSLERCVELFNRNQQYQFAVRQARKAGDGPKATDGAYGDESTRMRRFPGIAFRGSTRTRRAWLVGTALDVWEVVEAVKEFASLERLLDEGDLPEHQIRIALAYYDEYTAEIDQAIKENEDAQSNASIGRPPVVSQS